MNEDSSFNMNMNLLLLGQVKLEQGQPFLAFTQGTH